MAVPGLAASTSAGLLLGGVSRAEEFTARRIGMAPSSSFCKENREKLHKQSRGGVRAFAKAPKPKHKELEVATMTAPIPKGKHPSSSLLCGQEAKGPSEGQQERQRSGGKGWPQPWSLKAGEEQQSSPCQQDLSKGACREGG